MTAEKNWESWCWAAVNKWKSIYPRTTAGGQGWSEPFGSTCIPLSLCSGQHTFLQEKGNPRVGRAALASGWDRVRRNSADKWGNAPSLGQPALFWLHFLTPFWERSSNEVGGLREEANALGYGSPRQPAEDPLRPQHEAGMGGLSKTRLCGDPIFPSQVPKEQSGPRGTSFAGPCLSWVGSCWKWGRAGWPEAENEVRDHDRGESGLIKTFALWGPSSVCSIQAVTLCFTTTQTHKALGAGESPDASSETGL